MECKVSHHLQFPSGDHVLIETSWNVKLLKITTNLVREIVLIETSWNVKKGTVLKVFWIGEVLIETSWNVKDVEISHYLNGLCINRNIVECKGCFCF